MKVPGKMRRYMERFGSFILLLSLVIPLSFLSELASAATINVPTSKNTSGLVGYWPFGGRDISGTTVYDRSGQGNNGTSSGGPGTAIGKIGQAMSFDGTTDYTSVSHSSPLNVSGPITISAWVNAETFPAVDPGAEPYGIYSIVEKGFDGTTEAYYLRLRNTAGTVYLQAGSYSTPTSYETSWAISGWNANEWHHVVGQYDGTHWKVYFDGAQKASTSAANGAITNAKNVSVGAADISGTIRRFFNGKIDEVRVYNRALSASEIKQLYNSSINISQKTQINKLSSGLVGYWSLNAPDIYSTTAIDRSGQGNNGTLVSSPLPSLGKIGQALKFNGSSSYINAGSNSSLKPSLPITLSAWIKVNNLAASVGAAIAFRETANHNGYWFGTGTDGSLQVNYGDNTTCGPAGRRTKASSASLITVGEWYHVAAVMRGATDMSLYINGADVSGSYSGTGGSMAYNGSSFLRIGAIGGGVGCVGSFFDGLIDEARVYNRALSANEITALYRQGGSKIQSSQQTKQTSGLIGYWSFNGPDIAGVTAYDRSGQGNDGTLTNGPTKVIGKIGQALSFPGTDQGGNTPYVQIANESNFDFERTDDFSTCAWVNTRSITTPTVQTIVSKQIDQENYAGWEMDLFNQGALTPSALYFSLVNSNGTNQLSVYGPEIVTNRWYHMCATYDGSSSPSGVRLYYDGVSQSTTASFNSLSGSILNNARPGIGFRRDPLVSGSDDWPFNGVIDEVRVYNRVLSESEVRALYNQGR